MLRVRGIGRQVFIGIPAILALLLAMISAGGSALAQDGEPSLTAVCITGFEEPIHVQYLSDEQIAEIEGAEQDPAESPIARIVGYPDPATNSCATENGELMAYDPDVTTPICVPSGLRGERLVVQFASSHYLPAYNNVILADPVSGACPDQEAAESLINDDATTEEDTSDGGISSSGAQLPKTGAGIQQTVGAHGIVASMVAGSFAIIAATGAISLRTSNQRS